MNSSMEFRLSGHICRAMNQAALQDFMTIELVSMSSDEPLGAEMRDALIAVLESSAEASRKLAEAVEAEYYGPEAEKQAEKPEK